MIKINLSGQAILDLYCLHGEEAVDGFLSSVKEEIMDQIGRLKTSGAYQKHAEELNKRIISKAT